MTRGRCAAGQERPEGPVNTSSRQKQPENHADADLQQGDDFLKPINQRIPVSRLKPANRQISRPTTPAEGSERTQGMEHGDLLQALLAA